MRVITNAKVSDLLYSRLVLDENVTVYNGAQCIILSCHLLGRRDLHVHMAFLVAMLANLTPYVLGPRPLR